MPNSTDKPKTPGTRPSPTAAAKLIVEMWDADRWNPKLDLSGHPVLGPIIARRSARYDDLKRRMGFTESSLMANEEAIMQIMEACGVRDG